MTTRLKRSRCVWALIEVASKRGRPFPRHTAGGTLRGMETRTIRLAGPRTMGSHVRGRVLAEASELLVHGTQRALRLRTQGRSSARSSLPWIEAASDVVLSIGSSADKSVGPTLLHVEVPTLLEAAPTAFQQLEMFPELDASRTSVDYLVDSISAALSPNGDDALYDAPFLEFLRRRSGMFEAGIETMAFIDGAGRSRTLVELTVGSLQNLKSLEDQIPPPQRVRLAGFLDAIRASDLSFVMVLGDGTKIRGVAEDASTLQAHWKTRIMVSGRIFYTATRRILRVEADNIAPATDRDFEVWGLAPLADLSMAQLRRTQGPRSGLSAVFGRWPGDETDEEVIAALGSTS